MFKGATYHLVPALFAGALLVSCSRTPPVLSRVDDANGHVICDGVFTGNGVKADHLIAQLDTLGSGSQYSAHLEAPKIGDSITLDDFLREETQFGGKVEFTRDEAGWDVTNTHTEGAKTSVKHFVFNRESGHLNYQNTGSGIIYVAECRVSDANTPQGQSSPPASPAVAPPSPTASNAPDGALLQRCVDAALAVGYQEAHCAEAFIDICVETQSKARMAQIAYNDQNLLGRMRPGVGCGNGERAKYLREFTARQQQHDKF